MKLMQIGSKEYFPVFARKLKYKSSIIWTLGSPTARSPRPTPRGATINVSFLTCIKLRFLLSILKFKDFWSSPPRILCWHQPLLFGCFEKSIETSVKFIIMKVQAETLRKHHLLPSSFHWGHNPDLKHKSTSSKITQKIQKYTKTNSTTWSHKDFQPNHTMFKIPNNHKMTMSHNQALNKTWNQQICHKRKKWAHRAPIIWNQISILVFLQAKPQVQS